MLELFLGQIPEAIFFALFMLYAKNIKEKRILFVTLMITEYLLTKYSFKFNLLFHITFMTTVFLTLKLLYKEKSQITDVFILLTAYIVMSISSIIIYILFWKTINVFIPALIMHRMFLILFIILTRKKLYNLQLLYKKFWNRSNRKKKMKSVTFRALNMFIFNIMFYIINICMVFAIFIKGGVK